MAAFCREQGILRLSLFGSVLGESFGPDSDVDVLVHLDRSRRPSLYDLIRIRDDLQARFGRPVDVIDEALKDVRLSLLEADVEFRVVKKFLRNVKTEALGEQVALRTKTNDGQIRVRPEDHFVPICNDALVDLMGPVDTSLATASKGITGIMMVRLQGSGKTTSTG